MTFTSCLSPETAHAQEYPSCVSRESDLYRFYKTQEQRQWTASGIGGCTLYPRLLFPNMAQFQCEGYEPVQRPVEPDELDVI